MSSKDEDKDQNSSAKDVINVIKDAFDDSSPLAINQIRHWNSCASKNLYPRPSPPDLQYEERGSFSSPAFDGNSIHTWNIDGKSEHEILSTLQEMTMVVSAYKSKRLTDHLAATTLVIGF